MEFRKDINGLRAVAVMVVLLFHFGVPGFAGGFVGVDIFFVISGFLMTKIIFDGLERGSFSFFHFYLSRARRIIPALAVTVLAVLALGWLLLSPAEYRSLGKHAGGSLAFISNLLYWQEAGYFDAASHEKWLLHTWSLSVEFQFYVLYPILLVAAGKVLGRAHLKFFVAGLAALSLALSVYASKAWPEASFFILPTRAWELLAGGLVYLYPLKVTQQRSRMLEGGGIIMIVASVALFSSENIWPGWLAMVPVFGAVSLLIASRKASIFTANRGSQILGNASYSIYLWHWPVVVLLSYFGLLTNFLWIVVGVLASIALGYGSFRYVEGLAGKGGRYSSVSFTQLKIAFMVGAVGLFGSFIFLANGYPGRMTEDFMVKTQDLVMPFVDNGGCFYSVASNESLQIGDEGLRCHLGENSSELKAVLFGDSFAGHNGPFWDVVGKSLSIDVQSIATNWCYPAFTEGFTGSPSNRSYQQCLHNRRYLSGSLEKYDLIIFAGAWGAVSRQGKLGEVFDAILLAADTGRQVVIMAAPVSFDVNVKAMYERSILLGRSFDISKYSSRKDVHFSAANQELERLASTKENVVFFQRDSLFNIDGVPSDVTPENVPYSLDGSHLSLYGSKMSARAFIGSKQYRKFQDVIENLQEGNTPAAMTRFSIRH